MTRYNTISDNELADLIKSGDTAAFTEIYHRFSGLLQVYAYKLGGDTDLAKDMVQELFISFWDKRETTEFNSSLSAYLYTAVRYKFLKAVAHEKVKATYAAKFLRLFKEGAYTTDLYITEKELIKQVELLVADLPPKMARAFIMSRLEHRTHIEIAEELDISEKTVQNLLSKANQHLKPQIGSLALLFFLLNLS